jgi:VWFA-related protein
MPDIKSVFLRIAGALALLVLFSGLTQTVLAQSKVSLQIHDIKVLPGQDPVSYDVAVFFSLLDSARNPIKDAKVEDFTLTEDNLPVEIARLGLENEPINVAILLDTSGSMAGDKINAARSAASRFIENLQGNDQVAVLTFDQSIKHRIDFSMDHTAAKQQVALVEATPGGYTCLFDAAYETIQLAKALPSGRRAVILLTDGKDEASNGASCSLHTLAEVTSLASAGNTPIPIYTIGLGEAVNSQTLESLASGTNGRYQYSPMPTQLEALFSLLQDELRSAYGLHYVSTTTPGEHTLRLHVKYQSAEDEVSGRMDMPVLPYSLSFTTPVDAAVISGMTSLSVAVSGGGVPIQQVQFLVNHDSVGSDSTPPYGVDWDPVAAGQNAGPVSLEAVAQDASGKELARRSITITYKPAIIQPTLAASAAPETMGGKISLTNLLLAAAAGLVVIGIVVAILLGIGKRRRQDKNRAEAWQMTVQGLGAGSAAGTEDRTMDSFALGGNALGALVILQSDDPTMLNQRIEISHPVTHLGRKADNEVIFAKDSPVSRHHAVIEAHDGGLFLAEIVAADENTGQPKRPAYGTFVNGVQVQEPVRLQGGDEIMLGKRLRMRFETVQVPQANDDRTLDQVGSPGPDDKTVAAFADGKVMPSDSDVTLPVASFGKQLDTPGDADRTMVAGSTPKPETPGEADKTAIAGSAKQTDTPVDNDKTFIPGGGQQ